MKFHTHKVGLVGAGLSIAFFGLCMLWGMVITDPVLATLHLNLLKIAYPGFGFSFIGILIAITEAAVYGYAFGALFAWLCKVCCVHTTR